MTIMHCHTVSLDHTALFTTINSVSLLEHLLDCVSKVGYTAECDTM